MATVLLLLPLPCACFLSPRVSSAALRPSLPPPAFCPVLDYASEGAAALIGLVIQTLTAIVAEVLGERDAAGELVRIELTMH